MSEEGKIFDNIILLNLIIFSSRKSLQQSVRSLIKTNNLRSFKQGNTDIQQKTKYQYDDTSTRGKLQVRKKITLKTDKI